MKRDGLKPITANMKTLVSHNSSSHTVQTALGKAQVLTCFRTIVCLQFISKFKNYSAFILIRGGVHVGALSILTPGKNKVTLRKKLPCDIIISN